MVDVAAEMMSFQLSGASYGGDDPAPVG